MKTDLLKSIEKYFSNSIDLWDLVDDITYFKEINFDNLQNCINYLKKIESDEAMIVALLLWLVPKTPFKNECKSNNAFFKLLFSIEEPHSKFYDQNIIWHYIDNNLIVLEKGEYLVAINNMSFESSLQIPDKFINQKLYCLNCNEEMNLGYYIKVPEKSFYIFSKNI